MIEKGVPVSANRMIRRTQLLATLALVLICATIRADDTAIDIRAGEIVQPNHRFLPGVCLEDVNHEIYGGLYSQMIFGESFQELPTANPHLQVSGMWQPVTHGTAVGGFSLEPRSPFTGVQSQRMSFLRGQGDVALENRGLNHWGMNFIAGKSYEGEVWVRADAPTTLVAVLQTGDGMKTYAQQPLNVPAGNWTRLNFSLASDTSDARGAFALTLKSPGSITLGYVFLQPGSWGRFKNLPVRKDVAEALINQGVPIIRYGGSMVNAPAYRWKNMIGPRDRRPPYPGHWYPYSSNGWSVIDFLNLCEAASIVAVPDLNINESPQDLADFVEYVNGSADSEWGKRRAADGHPAPYHLTHLELGNEERVDEIYAAKFKTIAKAIWPKDPGIILIAGDFSYKQKIVDPEHIDGADSGIQNLNGQRQILDFTRQHNREVWFDVHVWSEGLQPSPDLLALPSYLNAIDTIANGAPHKVVVFELNANTHGQIRALANAISINTIRRDNRIPVVISANALQPDGQNDNGWDQGLLFLNPSRVWLQPPGYAIQMQARNNLQQLLRCDIGEESHLDVTATRSEDGKTLVLQVVNAGAAESAAISFSGFIPRKSYAHVTCLSATSNVAANTAEKPDALSPKRSDIDYRLNDRKIVHRFPGQSFTIIRFE
jgi:Alpha-L-arabinofuranosidase C-terminal domain